MNVLNVLHAKIKKGHQSTRSETLAIKGQILIVTREGRILTR